MTTPPPLLPQDVGIEKARPLDLFFDLVFVYAVSQITGLIAHPHSGLDYLQALLAGFAIAMMYNAFIWLTSNLNYEDDLNGYLLLLAMAGFFIMALSLETVRGTGGIAFGFALLVVTLLHGFMFRRVPNSSALAIQEVFPYNLMSALLVVFAAFAPGLWHWGLWLAALGVIAFRLAKRYQIAYLFSLSPLHYTERHGLLIIIAIGESIMGMGFGAQGLSLTLTLLAFVALGLVMASNFWWSYFGPDNARIEHRMKTANLHDRIRMASNMGLTHFVMLFGIMFAAAALEVGIHHPTQQAAPSTAWNLAIGVFLFYFGDVLFRRAMGIGPGRLRAALACAVLLTVPLGLNFNLMWQLLACLILMGSVTYVEDYVLEPKREAGTHA